MSRPDDQASALAAELIERYQRDQQVRAQPDKTPADFDRWRATDADNREWLKRVIAEHGWPGIGLVGTEAARAAWLLAQHADQDWRFQVECLRLMRDAAAGGDVEPWQVAYLADRVFSRVGRPQPFGTQYAQGADGQYQLLPVANGASGPPDWVQLPADMQREKGTSTP